MFKKWLFNNVRFPLLITISLLLLFTSTDQTHSLLNTVTLTDTFVRSNKLSHPFAFQPLEMGWEGKGTKVLVLDSGINLAHPHFREAHVVPYPIERTTSSIPFQVGMSPLMLTYKEKVRTYNDDGEGHGTAVAGTVLNIAPQTTLYSIKAYEESNQPSSLLLQGLSKAIEWQDLDVINFSGTLLQKEPLPIMDDYIELLRSAGTLTVVSAGNDGEKGVNSLYYPANNNRVLTVGSITLDGNGVSSFSSRDDIFGMKPDILALGEKVKVPKGDGYTYLEGTSISAPYVSGAAALIKQKHPTWTPDKVKNALSITATPLEFYAPWEQGSGKLNIEKALQVDTHIFPYKVVTESEQEQILIHNIADDEITYTVQGKDYIIKPNTAQKVKLQLTKPFEYIPISNSKGLTYTIPAMLNNPDLWKEGISLPNQLTNRVYFVAVPKERLSHVVFRSHDGETKTLPLQERRGVYYFKFEDDFFFNGTVSLYNTSNQEVYTKNYE